MAKADASCDLFIYGTKITFLYKKTLALTSHVCQLLEQGKRRPVCKNFTLMDEAFLHCIIAIQHNSRYTPEIEAEDLWGGRKRNKNVKCYYNPILSTRSEKVKQHWTSMQNAELNNLQPVMQVTRGGTDVALHRRVCGKRICFVKKVKLISPHYMLCFAGLIKKPALQIKDWGHFHRVLREEWEPRWQPTAESRAQLGPAPVSTRD